MGTSSQRPLALISVSDKSGVAEFACALALRGYEILSTGGTARTLRDAGLKVMAVEELTGFPEMLSGRVKTLHPLVHGGLLGLRDDPEHSAQMREHGIRPIDLIVIDLYPFEATIARAGVTRGEAIEQIDIGGPAMIRSGAKNHAFVTVVTDPGMYDEVLADMNEFGRTTATLRTKLAQAAFLRTSAYDATIASYLDTGEEALPRALSIGLRRDRTLRYGENPHQEAAVYRTGASEGGVLDAAQLLGKELSFNNLADAAAAWALTCTLAELEPRKVSAVVVKHANPCGAAVADDVFTAIDGAMAGDPVAAFGGIMGVSAEIDERSAERLCAEGVFLEVLCAPGFTKRALEVLSQRWKNLRLLATRPVRPASRLVRLLPGGALVQTPDALSADPGAWTLGAGAEPGTELRRTAHVIEAIAQALSSNAIAIGGLDPDRPGCVRLFGAGAGQMDRLTACRLACEKAGELARGAVAVSDAFFPFDDGPRILADAGVRVIVHPGGSKRDEDTFALCRERGIACLLTGLRHFRHEPLR